MWKCQIGGVNWECEIGRWGQLAETMLCEEGQGDSEIDLIAGAKVINN